MLKTGGNCCAVRRNRSGRPGLEVNGVLSMLILFGN